MSGAMNDVPTSDRDLLDGLDDRNVGTVENPSERHPVDPDTAGDADGGDEMTADPERQDRGERDPEQRIHDDHIERETAKADEADGEGDAANDTEARYGEDESPA